MDEENPPSDLGELIARDQYEEASGEGAEPVQQAGGFHLSRTSWIVIGLVVVAGVVAYYLIQRNLANNAATTTSSSAAASVPLTPSAGVSEGSANPNAGTVNPSAPSTGSGIAGETASLANNSAAPAQSISSMATPFGTQTHQSTTVQGTPIPSSVVTPVAGTKTTVATPGSGVPIAAQSYQVATPQGTQQFVATPGGMVEGVGAGAMALSSRLGINRLSNSGKGSSL